MAGTDFEIEIQARVDQAISELNKLNRTAQQSAVAINTIGLIEIGRVAIDSIKKLATALHEPIALAAETEEKLTQLNNALALNGEFSEEAANRLEEFASQMQQTTKFSDDAILSSAALIENIARLSADELPRATKASADLATALGIDLETASRLVAKAAEGNVDAFKRFGVEIQKGRTDAESFSNTLEVLESRFGGAAEGAAKTFSGARAILGNNFEDVLKTIGLLIVQNPLVIFAINKLSEGLRAFIEFIKSNSAAIDKFVTKTLQAMISSLQFLGKAAEFVTKKLAFLVGVVGVVTGQNSFADIEKSLEKISGFFDPLQNALAKTSDEAKKIGDNFVTTGKRASVSIANVVKQMERLTDEQAKQLIKSPIGSIIQGTVPNVAGSGAALGLGFASAASKGDKGAVEFAQEAAGAAAEAFGASGPMGAAIGEIVGVLAQGPEKAAAFFAAFITSIPTIIENIILAIPAVIQAIIDSIPLLVEGILAAIPELIVGLINAIPQLVQSLIDAIPQLIQSLVTHIPEIIQALIANLPTLFLALISNIPRIVNELIVNLIKEAPRFIIEFVKGAAKGIADAIKNLLSGGLAGGGDGGGGFLSKVPIIGGLFAEGGEVPSGFPNDSFPAALTSGENVISAGLSDRLESFLNQSGQSPAGARPAQINISIGEKQLASVLLDLNTAGFRTA